jgi:hypothetical protein
MAAQHLLGGSQKTVASRFAENADRVKKAKTGGRKIVLRENSLGRPNGVRSGRTPLEGSFSDGSPPYLG